jgi:PPOX class probable F420-dependent enzyme
MTDAAGRHELPAGAIRVIVTGPATGGRRDRGDREEAADASYFAPLAKAGYLLLTTFKPKGTPVSAHVQGIVDDGGRAYFRIRSRSGMVRRLQQTDGVQVAPCGALGLWSYGPPLDATTRRLAGAEAGQVAGQLARKYPVRRRSLARLLPRAWRRRLVYYELLLRGSIAYTQTRRISLTCNGETSKLPGSSGAPEKGRQPRVLPQSPPRFPPTARIARPGPPLAAGRRRHEYPGPRRRVCHHDAACSAGRRRGERVGPRRRYGRGRMGPGRLHDDARPRQCGRCGQPELGRILLGRQPGDVHERVRVLGPARGDMHRDGHLLQLLGRPRR